MKKLLAVFIVLIALSGVYYGAKFFVSAVEGKWVCENGDWVKKGNPLIPKPDSECLSEAIEETKQDLNNLGQCVSDSGVSLSFTEAKTIAERDCLDGSLKEEQSCNKGTGTWWIDFEPNEPKDGCNPACVVNIETKSAEINWRCTGLKAE